MKVAITSDLHIGYEHYETAIEELAHIFRDVPRDVDAILIAGDITTSGNVHTIRGVIDTLTARFSGKVLFVPGNHDYYGDETIEERNQTFLENFGKNVVLPGFSQTIGDSIVVGGCGFYNPVPSAESWLLRFPDARHISQTKRMLPEDMALRAKNDVKQIGCDIESAVEHGYKNIILMTHVPGANNPLASGFDHFFQNVDILGLVEQFKPSLVVSGHTHRPISDDVLKHYNAPWGYAQERHFDPVVIEV